MKELGLTAGTSRATITPPIGTPFQGYSNRVACAQGIDMDLFATALVLADERAKVAIIDVDVLEFSVAQADAIREQVGQAIGTPRSHVLLAPTHTHNSPPVTKSFPDPREQSMADAFLATLPNYIVGAARMADGRRQPARVGAGIGYAPVSINRRETQPDGSIMLGQNPDGPTDHSLPVVRVDDAAGKPLAAIVNFGCHPNVLGPEPLLFSPDYIGVLRNVVEKATGATCLYLNGAGGDQIPLEFWQDDPALERKIGGILGHEAVKVLLGTETRRVQRVRKYVKSLAEILVYVAEELPGPWHEYLGAAEKRLALPLQPLPSLSQSEQIYAERSADLEREKAAGNPRLIYIATIEYKWAKRLLERVRQGIVNDTVEAVVQAIMIDDVAIVSAPGEAFARVGLMAKQRSPLRNTLFAGFSNGNITYILDAESVPKPGEKVKSPDAQSYKINLPSPLAAECAGLIVDTQMELLQGLLAEKSARVRT